MNDVKNYMQLWLVDGNKLNSIFVFYSKFCNGLNYRDI